MFQVEWKNFFTSITRREYEGGKKMTKKKLEMSGTKEDKDQEKHSLLSTTETDAPIDPEMPPLEDTDAPTRPKQFKSKKPTPRKHHLKR